MTDDTRLLRYAEIVVRVGLNIQPGQELLLRADLDHAEVARAVTEQAYLAGASRVTVEYLDPHVRRSTLQHAPMEKLTEAPGWRLAQIREAGEQGTAILTLTGSADPHLFDDIAPERLAAMPLELANLSRQVMLGGDVSWAVVAAPNPGWAEQVFGAPDVERLWEAVSVAMRLDSVDVVKEWREHSERLQARARALEVLDLDTIRYHGEGTDLTAGLVPGCRWVSGSIASKSGVEFMPNLPTEEVFTSPDRRRADGTIRLTRPLVMPRAGVVVEGLVVRFEGGRAVDVTAESNAEAVRAELDADEGARSLGEVSLVDGSSKVREAGVVFHNTLYDENAGCHVAWGQGFPMAVPDGQSLGSDELFDLGINRSAVHTDVVVGGPGVDVTGTTRDGREVAIIADDAWVLPLG
ncbi:MAG TPA: aminopeptidase [Actinomycetes bacterium]